MNTSPETVGRRSALRSALSGLGAAMITAGISGCRPVEQDTPMPPQVTANSPSAQITPEPRKSRRVLLAYFSRAGENYDYGGRTNLDVGNTEVLAGMIGTLIACDVHRIEAADPYSDGYDATVARNVREQDGNVHGHRLAAALDRGLRHRAAGQRDLERPGADDHDDIRREL